MTVGVHKAGPDISPPRITNISSASAALIVGLEEDEPIIPEARRVESPIEAEPLQVLAFLHNQPTFCHHL